MILNSDRGPGSKFALTADPSYPYNSMRECLGWVTSCPDERRCPMNWLELAVSELPTAVRCHICEQEVQLVLSSDELEANTSDGVATAFPVVPCAGAPAHDYVPGGGGGGGGVPANGAAGAVRPAPAPAPAPAPRPLDMYVTLLSGESIKIDKDTMIVGRSRTCDVIIPSAKVSRQHASISRVNGELYMEDLGSANGVWKDGEKIGRSKISDGDVYTISEETLTFDMH